jgi:acyl carrier protein phosphodiesterase
VFLLKAEIAFNVSIIGILLSMNFLAHLYLAYPDEELMLGNFIADSVKGNPEKFYSGRILEGIRMHRQIDHFTDTHTFNKEFNAFLRPEFGRYAGVVSDIFHDHFLAKNWKLNSDLEVFSHQFYRLANARKSHFPEKVQYLLPFMEKQNWLLAYASVEGIGQVCRRMSQRVKVENRMDLAQAFLENNYEAVLEFSARYFPELEKEFSGWKK